ncbi:MAG: ATP-binding protein [Verrucomicrobiota bacterium]
MTTFRQFRWWLLFGAGLLVAMAGWMWIMVRLVRSESEAAEARVRQAEERLLETKVGELSKRINEISRKLVTIPELARSGDYAGWWKAEIVETPPGETINPDKLAGWRNDIREGRATAADLKMALAGGDLHWGRVEDGRDPVAAFLPLLHRNGDRSTELMELLKQRVWDYGDPPLSPAFRLTLIRPLLELEASEPLERLLEAETIRASEGRVEELERDYELVELRQDGLQIRTFWTPTQMLGLLDSPSDYQLFDTPPKDRASVTVPGLRRWPHLAASSSLGSSGTAQDSALIWIGGASGLGLLALALTAIFFGRHQLRVARMRTDLAASVAHELRTPLAGQRLLLESLLDRTDQSEEERNEYIAMAFRENRRLGRLAEEFLTFSRLERGVLQLENEVVEVAEAVNEAVESLREKWDDPDCRLTLEIDDGVPPIAGDREALVTILRNLLENAWKYSTSPKNIGVRAIETEDSVAIAVSDRGIGLSPAEQQRIFRQFYRVDQRLARAEDGLGLGLSIVKRLTESMHGEVAVDSREGEGSTFTVRIPRSS